MSCLKDMVALCFVRKTPCVVNQKTHRGAALQVPPTPRLRCLALRARASTTFARFCSMPKHADVEECCEDQPNFEMPLPLSVTLNYVPKANSVEEEEHPAPADSVVVALPVADQAPSAEETKPSSTYTIMVGCRVSKLPRYNYSTPPSSPLSPWSSPLPQIPSPPLPPLPSPSLPLSPPSPVLSLAPPPSPIRSLAISCYAKAASTSYSLPLPPLSPIPAPTSSPPLLLPSTNRREDRPEVTLPPRKRLGIALGPRYEIGESSSAAAARPAGGLRADYGFVATMDREIRRDLERDVGYGITDSWDEIVEAMQGTPVVTDVAEFSHRMTEFETRVRRDTNEVYTRLDGEQTGRQLLAGRLNMLFRDRHAHAPDRRRQAMITEMLVADHRRQEQLAKALKLVKRLQTQMAELQRQQGPANGPAQLELPKETGSSS
ncbi:hypothetical protein Tco_0261269 [Tanacetum coccineum]